MDEQNDDLSSKSPSPGDTSRLVIPSFNGSSAISLDMTSTREAESRFIEVKTVNPLTYTDLEHTFNEAYRELKRHHSNVGYQIALADKILEQAKAEILLDKYPEFMKDRPKSHDSADIRKAFMMRDPEYLAALDRLNQLKAIENFIDGKIKVLENISRTMRKQMDLIIRSGLSGADLYSTHGRK